jgi:DivIVA domain-containing protein
MVLTPQLIKDQEFQQKFRGVDPLEVRDYLEIVANEFFELQEQCAEQLEELETLRDAKESTESYTGSLETDMEFTRKISEELKDSCAQKEIKLKELEQEVEELQLRIDDMKQEETEHDEELSTMEVLIEEGEVALKECETEKNTLLNKIEVLKEQNEELKKDEVSFKSTLASAQLFTENLKEKSRKEADEMIADAHAEIAQIRGDAHDELERLPIEIDALRNKKKEVKEDLKATLKSYLETIEVFYPDDGGKVGQEGTQAAESDDNDELFQKIDVNEDGSLSPEDVEKLNDNPESSMAIDEEVLDSLLKGEDGNAKSDDIDLNDVFSNLESQKGEEK